MAAPRVRLDIDATRDKLAAHLFLDRLLHRAQVLNIKDRSYRLRELEDALRT